MRDVKCYWLYVIGEEGEREDEFASVQFSAFREEERKREAQDTRGTLVAAIIGRRVNEMRFTAAKEKDAARSKV